MPQSTSPPYSPNAIIQPRQLQRWLDVNPQNGPLTRTSTFIQLPIFAQGNSTWDGFSDIIFAYNVESPQSVGLNNYIIPTSPNYTLCISSRVGNTITRYVVWYAIGTVFPFDIVLYTGQRLPDNWRFEIWNTAQGVVSNVTPITFYTTALGNIDYRYGNDSALVVADGQSNSFDDAVVSVVNAPPTTGLVGWFKADTLTAPVDSWVNIVNGLDTLSYDGTHHPALFTEPEINNIQVVDMSTGQLSATRSSGLQTLFNATFGDDTFIFVIMKSSNSVYTDRVLSIVDNISNTICTINLVATLNTINFNSFPNNSTSPVNNQNYFMAVLGSAGVWAQSIVNRVESPLLGNSPTGTQMYTWTLGEAHCRIAEILVYKAFASENDYTTFLQYLSNRYGSNFVFNLPLTFPAGSVSVTN